MNYDEFKLSLKNEKPPQVPPLLVAMWHDGTQDWNGAHTVAQDIGTRDGSWVHAYLHRKEGDDSNAGYWYRRAGRKFPGHPLSDEWEIIVKELLGQQ